MGGNKINNINTYYLLTAGFLYSGKGFCNIDMKREKHGEPTVPYGPSLLMTFLGDIYEQHFQARLVDWIFKTCVCADGHSPKIK